MYDRILLSTDGTVASEEAEAHAIALADVHDAVLHVLYVIDEDVYSAYTGDEYVDEHEGLEHALEERGRDALDEVRTRADGRDVRVVGALQHGVPHEAILAYAGDQAIDLLVMGTRRRPAEYRQVLGSVTDRVSQIATRPVLIVKSPGPDA